ncbi:hypothetical protein J2S17_005938 [Cytobacillus purgationiresistens]|uniref:Uncharacterized protein n=1 Tax=Cytobacillus purgationiresistens TaxID=863449 RepID=A0ABU0ARU9_9BACI|nr:hypothetical protein [Cytobacillus purgationiresistens]
MVVKKYTKSNEAILDSRTVLSFLMKLSRQDSSIRNAIKQENFDGIL